MKCPICNNELNDNLECAACGFIDSIIKCDDLINYFENTIGLSNSYEEMLKEKEKDFLLFSKKDFELNEGNLKLLERDIQDGDDFAKRIEELLNEGKKLWQKYKSDERNIMNVHHCLAVISHIDNLFDSIYYQRLHQIVEDLKDKIKKLNN